MLKQYFEREITLTGRLSKSELLGVWQRRVEKPVMPVTGKPYFKHFFKGEAPALLFYISYAKDFCDTAFSCEVFDVDGICQLYGKITASPGARRFAYIFLAACVLLGGLYLAFPLWGYAFYGFSGAIIVGAAVAFMSLSVQKNRVQDVMEYVQKLLNGENEDERA